MFLKIETFYLILRSGDVAMKEYQLQFE